MNKYLILLLTPFIFTACQEGEEQLQVNLTIDFDKTLQGQKYRYDNLRSVIDRLGDLGYHDNDLKVSDWPLAIRRWI